MEREVFDQLIQEALQSIPEEFQTRLDNVELLVTDWPTKGQLRHASLPPGQTLFGLYQGVPHTRRGASYGLVPPDTIILFRGPIGAVGRTRAGMARIIRRTVLHEIGHHFGLDEERLRILGY